MEGSKIHLGGEIQRSHGGLILEPRKKEVSARLAGSSLLSHMEGSPSFRTKVMSIHVAIVEVSSLLPCSSHLGQLLYLRPSQDPGVAKHTIVLFCLSLTELKGC